MVGNEPQTQMASGTSVACVMQHELAIKSRHFVKVGQLTNSGIMGEIFPWEHKELHQNHWTWIAYLKKMILSKAGSFVMEWGIGRTLDLFCGV